jgi:hypothetical protein
LEDFMQWMANQGYAPGTMGNYLKILPKAVRWLRRHRITDLDHLTQQQLKVAHDYYRPKQEDPSWVFAAWGRFLSERHLVPQGALPPSSPVEVELARFTAYLRETRGVAEATISGHCGRLRAFLQFLRFDRNPDGVAVALTDVLGAELRAPLGPLGDVTPIQTATGGYFLPAR